ncbi:MAG: RDD family protein [Campylobacterales bacterium]
MEQGQTAQSAMASELEYVGFWARTGATIVDSIIFLAVIYPPLLTIYGMDYLQGYHGFVAGPADLLLSWIFPIVATVLFWKYRQATPGKMLVKAKIVDAKTGGEASTGQLIGRYFAYILSMLPLCLGYIWVAFDSKKRGWHDILAGTVVVRPKNHGPEEVRFEGVRK